MIPCPKWIDVESPEGGGCMDRQEFVAWEACRGCPLNPDPEGFPPGDSLYCAMAIDGLRLGPQPMNMWL
jgi:hypothetical protein